MYLLSLWLRGDFFHTCSSKRFLTSNPDLGPFCLSLFLKNCGSAPWVNRGQIWRYLCICDEWISYSCLIRGNCTNPIRIQCRPCTVSVRRSIRGSLRGPGRVRQWAQYSLHGQQCAGVRGSQTIDFHIDVKQPHSWASNWESLWGSLCFVLNAKVIIEFFPTETYLDQCWAHHQLRIRLCYPACSQALEVISTTLCLTQKSIFWITPRLKATSVFYLAVPSTNPFVAAAVAPEMATNPFQTNGRAPAAGVWEF